jgi:hypothetical protein
MSSDSGMSDGGNGSMASDPTWAGDTLATGDSTTPIDPGDSSGQTGDAGSDGAAGNDGSSGADSSGFPGDPFPPADPTPPAVVPKLYFQSISSSSPVEITTPTSQCLGSNSVLTLEGPAGQPWRITSGDATGGGLPSIPSAAPGELAPAYLGGGHYSREGYATVLGSEVAPTAATLAIDIDGAVWTITNTCAAPLLQIWVYPDGLAGQPTEVGRGTTICPAAAPWALAFGPPLASSYDIAVFDFSPVSVTYYDEQTLPQDADGLVVLPSVPISGRVAFGLLDDAGQEVESASVYLDCG